MTSNLSGITIEKALNPGETVDRQSRITTLEKQLAKVRKDIAEQVRLEKRYATLERAFSKLRRELGKTLTNEEYQAMDGAYIFLHSGCIDLVRHLPSATSKGEDTKLLKDLDTAEAMRELATLTE